VAELLDASPERRLDVFMVHGMCTHDAGWADASIRRLSAQLQGPAEPRIDSLPVPDTRVTLYQSTFPVPGGTLRAHALLWSPAVAPLKHQLCYDQTDKSAACKAAGHEQPAYRYKRASINKALKDQLLNDCLADAIIYQGQSRDIVSRQIQSAILALASGAAAEDTPLVFVTESLGSKVAFDAIYRMAQSGEGVRSAAARQIAGRTVQVFMLANQMPILALADQQVGAAGPFAAARPAYPADPLEALIELRRGERRRPFAALAAPQVVAFTDPNDLLSYVLAPAQASYEVIDVVVSNDKTYFGAFERPDTAHLGYRENPAVTRLIACGTSSRGCAAR
jgi:hypothetical protein